MNPKKTSRRARQPKRRAKAPSARKPRSKRRPVYYARESLPGPRLIRQEVTNTLAKAPVLG